MSDSNATPPSPSVTARDIKIKPATAADNSLPASNEGTDREISCNSSSSIITIVRDPENILGKKFHVNSDDTIGKKTAVSLSFGTACMRQVDTHEQLAALLQHVGDDSHAAIINSGFKGIDIGEEFIIASANKIAERTGIPASDRDKQKGVHAVEHSKKK